MKTTTTARLVYNRSKAQVMTYSSLLHVLESVVF